MSVVIETTKGIFTVDLYTDQRPKTCKNFLKLCKVKYYNFSLFHTVQANFIAQTGDPTGIGRNGGESIFRRLYGDQATFYEGELLPKIKHTKRGQISMVTVGDNLFGSQFFIALEDNLDYLDGSHCVFGEIVEGLDEILQAFNEAICDEEHRPYQDIRIAHTVILDDPFEDPPGLEIPDRSPPPSKEMLASTRIGADEDLDDYDGMDDKEIAEMMAEKEAKAQATILEMIGDLPEADVAPPENVLFVCKLNPVTTDDDLEIIFSRFGKVKNCEVIRDKKSGDSLQYAFVEFEDEKSCEKAYFKMDNVLIDDRRIHVDFSQSVSKYQWKGKGRLEIFDEKPGGGKPSNTDNKRGRNERSNPNIDSRSFDRRDYPQKDAKNGRRDDYIDRDRNSDRRRDDYKYERKREEDSRERRNESDRQKDRKIESSIDRQKDRKGETSTDRNRDRSRDRPRYQSNDGNRKHHDESRDKQKDRKRDDSRDRQKDRKKCDDSRDRKKDRKKTKDRHSDSSDDSEEHEHLRKSSKKKEKKHKRDRSRSNSRERHSKKYKNY